MNYSKIKRFSIENGPGCRISLFVSGCRNRCKGCFNPETWNFNYGREFTSETLQELQGLLSDEHVAGLSILGGDPFEPENQQCVYDICRAVREQFGDSKTIWIWTGYHWEDLRDNPIMKYIDVLVDGPFVEELKDLRLFYRGSRNQRVIDIPESNTCGAAIRWKGEQKWR